MVLEVDVVRVEVLAKCARNVPMGPVVIELRPQVGISGKRARPPADQILAAHCDVRGARLADAAIVEVPLEADVAHL